MSPRRSRPVALFCRQVKIPVLLHLPIFPASPETSVCNIWKQTCNTPRLWPSCSHNALWARIGLLTCLMTKREKRKEERKMHTKASLCLMLWTHTIMCSHLLSAVCALRYLTIYPSFLYPTFSNIQSHKGTFFLHIFVFEICLSSAGEDRMFILVLIVTF